MSVKLGYIVVCLAVLARLAGAGQPPLTLADPAVPTVRLPTSRPAVAEAAMQWRLKVFTRPRALAGGAVTSDWPTFLGPTHNAVSAETKLRKNFTSPPPMVWRLIRGDGFSAPSVAGDRLVVHHRIGNEEIVECLHAERGSVYWQFRYGTTYVDRFGYNGGPRATPAIAGGRVYTYGAQNQLHCLDLRTGHVYWKRDIAREFKTRPSFFGATASPVVVGGLVIVNIGGGAGPAVAAFDARTGRLAWGAETKWAAGYASPVPATIHGKRVMFVFAGGWSDPATGGLICLDPLTGTTHFRFPFRSRRIASVNASSPVVVGDTVFISSIYDIGGALLRVGGDLKHTVLTRTKDYSSHWMTPIVRDGYLYGFADAKLVCMALKTGKEVWSAKPTWAVPAGGDGQRRKGSLGRASLLWADGVFLCLGGTGDLCWLDLSPKGMKMITRTKLFHARHTWVCPVLSRGLLYVCQIYPDRRTGRPPRLICYDLRAGQ